MFGDFYLIDIGYGIGYILPQSCDWLSFLLSNAFLNLPFYQHMIMLLMPPFCLAIFIDFISRTGFWTLFFLTFIRLKR